MMFARIKRRLDDVVRLKKACRFNGCYAITLLDKRYFTKMLGGFGENLPSIFGLLRGGRYQSAVRLSPVGCRPTGPGSNVSCQGRIRPA